MRWILVLVLFTACGAPLAIDDDAGVDTDAGNGAGDAGATDAGPDAGAGLDAGSPDAGATDAGSTDAGSTDAGRLVVVYPFDRAHSPVTAELAANLRAIAARRAQRDDVFSKIGDSNTVNTNYLACYAGMNVDLAGRTALQPTLDRFRMGMAGSTTPFNRTSLAATVGWSAGAALAGTPSPLQQEVDAVSPRLATVMFGTNDVGFQDTHTFGRNMFTIVDVLLAQGVVPILSSVPPRDSPTADAWVPRYNLVTRGVAQARGVPFVDLHRALLPIPSHGLGPDGVHLNVYVPSGSARGCLLTSSGLQYGNNVRNLLTLEALARADGALRGGAPDATAPTRAGDGTRANPIVIDSLPFVDVRDTRVDGTADIAAYPGCASTADESGREVLYRLELAAPANLRVFVVSLGASDIDVHLLSAPTGQACLQRNDRTITRQLAAGTYWLSLDTYAVGGAPRAGEYLVGVLAD